MSKITISQMAKGIVGLFYGIFQGMKVDLAAEY
jgi:hypothetical protein